MAAALQKGIESLAAQHGKDLGELQRAHAAEEQAGAGAGAGAGAAGAEPAAKQAWEDAKANYKPPSARAITQETFDEVVAENVEDFDMELKEAIADACLQFMKQGVNLSNIIKTEAHFSVKDKDTSDHPVTIGLNTLQQAVVAKDDSDAAIAKVCTAIADLDAQFGSDEEAVPIANSKQGVGTCVTLLRTFPTSSCVVPALNLVRKMCVDPPSLNQFNEFGLGPDVVIECISRERSAGAGDPANASTDVLVAGLALVKVAALKHNGCKDQFFGRGIAGLLQYATDTFPDNVAVVKESVLAFRSVVRGDGTIDSKAPNYLKQLVEEGWLERLCKLLLRHLNREDQNIDAAGCCALALSSVAMNEKACTDAADQGIIGALLTALNSPAYMTNALFVRRVASLLGALARSDKNKELISDGIGTFGECMIKNAQDDTVQKAFLNTLAAICLRQPEIALKIVQEKGTTGACG